ncbi:MAG TPA: OmpA family protein [Burkholderiaceae bacterium]|nr:OmpA family protein [Burkholderiaceae bacterium]
MTRNFDLSADGMFGFGKSDLSDVGRSRIDNMVQGLKSAGFRPRSVTVTGYTDPLGSAETNQRLSLERANAVRDYMVSQGVPANVIQTEGRGAADPKVTQADCKARGQAKSRNALIACLLPNRRVEIRATGEQSL